MQVGESENFIFRLLHSISVIYDNWEQFLAIQSISNSWLAFAIIKTGKSSLIFKNILTDDKTDFSLGQYIIP